MAFTVAEIINIAEVSIFLSSQDVAKSGLFGGSVDRDLPIKLSMELQAVEWKYGYDPSATDLISTSNYLYDLCGQYAAPAWLIINEGEGGTMIGGETFEGGGSSGGGSFTGDLFN